ncbi:MAG: hypothetical protein ABIJ03_02050 [Patescibacteria group bacterium]
MIHQLFLQFFATSRETDTIISNEKSFFDYSSEEKIKIMRAAGRQAQKEQQQLLKDYEARFERVAY